MTPSMWTLILDHLSKTGMRQEALGLAWWLVNNSPIGKDNRNALDVWYHTHLEDNDDAE